MKTQIPPLKGAFSDTHGVNRPDGDVASKHDGSDQKPQRNTVLRGLRLSAAVLSCMLVAAFLFKGISLSRIHAQGVLHIEAPKTAFRVAPANPGGEIAGSEAINMALNDVIEAAPLPPITMSKPAPAPVAPTFEDLAMVELQDDEVLARDASRDLQSESFKHDVADAIMAALLTSSDDQLAVDTQEVRYMPNDVKPPRIAPPQARPTLAAIDTPTAMKLIAPAQLEKGARLVQLGAYNNESDALAQWDRLSSTHSAFFAQKNHLIQKAQSAGHVFYRLRVAGFDDLAETRRFCTALLAKGVDCITAVHK